MARACEDALDAAANAHGPNAGELVVGALEALGSLPARVLADGGASSGRARRTLARLERLDRHEPLDGEADFPSQHRPPPSASARARRRQLTADQRLAARIEGHLGRGSVSRGARALRGAPLADAGDPLVRRSLQDKHPRRPLPEPLAEEEPALQVTLDQLDTALARAERNRGAAGGPTGWTFEQLRAAVKASPEAREGAHGVVNLLLSGKLPRCGVLLDSLLIGLAKPTGGVRPIATGEVWYRLSGLCALVALEGLGRSLAPLQLCVGIPGGAEATGLAVRAAMLEDRESMVLSVDVENCFNAIGREALFASVKRHAPSLLPYVQWAYGAPTALHMVGAPAGTPPLESVAGVKQGDPLGPLLAALVLRDVQKHVARGAPGVLQVAYADDINLVGRAGPLRAAWQCLGGARGLPSAGLRLQAPKSVLYGGAHAPTAALAQELGVTHAPDGIVVAGTPVGSLDFVSRFVLKRAEDVVADVEEAMRLPLRTQSRWLLLRMSLSQRMAHLMRVVLWMQLGPAMRRVEQALLSAAAAIFRLPSGQGPGAPAAQSDVLAQLFLPERVGGFGLRSASETGSGAALVACAALAQAALADAPEALQPLRGAARHNYLAVWRAVFDDVGTACSWEAEERELPEAFESNRALLVQHRAARAIANREAAALLPLSADGAAPPAQQRAAARLRSAAGGPASAVWTAVPTSPATRLSDDDLVMAGRHRLGLGPGLGIGPAPCTCGVGDASAPDHAQVCKFSDDIFRHDLMVNTWRCVIRDAGCATAGSRRTAASWAPRPACAAATSSLCSAPTAWWSRTSSSRTRPPPPTSRARRRIPAPTPLALAGGPWSWPRPACGPAAGGCPPGWCRATPLPAHAPASRRTCR